MGKIEDLAAVYERHVSVPWQRSVSGAQRVMLVVYDKELERTLRDRIGEFEQATHRSAHVWTLVDCTKWFAEWMAQDEYREAWFEDSGSARHEAGERVSRSGRRQAANPNSKRPATTAWSRCWAWLPSTAFCAFRK